MKNKNSFSFRERLRSFGFALNGLYLLFKEEHNARIHLVFSFVAIFLGLFFRISRTEWMFVVLSIGLVFVAEIMNSAIERLADFVTKEKHKAIQQTKDLAAGAVLVSAISALVAGLFIFVPKCLSFFIATFAS